MPFPKLAPLTVAYRLVITGTGQRARSRRTVTSPLQRGRAQAGVLVISLGAPLVRAELLFFARTIAQRMAKAMST